MSGDEPIWGTTEYLLADLIDAVSANTWVSANKSVEPRNRQPFPDPVTRPGAEKPQQKHTVSAADLLAHRERTRKGK